MNEQGAIFRSLVTHVDDKNRFTTRFFTIFKLICHLCKLWNLHPLFRIRSCLDNFPVQCLETMNWTQVSVFDPCLPWARYSFDWNFVTRSWWNTLLQFWQVACWAMSVRQLQRLRTLTKTSLDPELKNELLLVYQRFESTSSSSFCVTLLFFFSPSIWQIMWYENGN